MYLLRIGFDNARKGGRGLDLDSRLPNLALMKLSRHFKDQGRRVVLARHEAFVTGVESVYASAVFSTPSTLNRLARLKRYYGDSLVAGGSGIDVKLRLPPGGGGSPRGLQSIPGAWGPRHRLPYPWMLVSLSFLPCAHEGRRCPSGQ
jgi:hypothetical protein